MHKIPKYYIYIKNYVPFRLVNAKFDKNPSKQRKTLCIRFLEVNTCYRIYFCISRNFNIDESFYSHQLTDIFLQDWKNSVSPLPSPRFEISTATLGWRAQSTLLLIHKLISCGKQGGIHIFPKCITQQVIYADGTTVLATSPTGPTKQN